MCEYSSHLCSNTGCKEVENLEDMDTHLKGSCGYRAVGVCQRGCGLVLPHKELVQGNHCCLSALRAQNGALQVKSARLEQAAKKERLEFGVREQFLLAQVSALQNEARLTALNYQKKLRQYMVHINNITKQLLAGHNKGEYDQPLSITLQEVEDSLDFKISSGQQGLEATGVGMSHLSERGPAALRDGPQVHDRILEVNGKDLSKATPDEAVEAFCHARDPIVVQVLRRSPAPRSHGNSQEICLVDVCTQTDITFEHIMALSKLRPPTPPLPDICPFLLSDSCHSLQTMEQEFYEGTEYLSHIPASCDRAEEYEYEEVELCRQNSQEKLGLTLCYRTDDEEDVGIYVSEVGPDSIAARDGRIREGDRILQINGQDIQNKEEAVTVLSNEDCINILLLVARPEIQLDEGWLDDEQNDFLEELKMEMLEEQRKDEIKHSAVQQVGTMVEPRERDEVDEEIRADVATCSSNVQDEASTEGDTPSRVQSRSTHGLQDRNRVPGEQLDSDCTTPQADEEDEEDEEECERFQQLLELKCQIRNSGEYDLYYSRRSTIECSLGEPEGMQRELRLLNEELRSIELECQNIMQAHQLRLTQNQSPGGSPMVNKPAHICELPEKSDKDRDKDKDSSSAYNTAESCRSTPLAMRRSSDNSLQRTVSTANLKNLRATAAAQSRQAKPGILEQKEASPSPSPSPSLSPSPYLSPYRHANIPAHARHYQSYMHLIQQRSAVEYGQSQLSLLSMCKDPQRPGESSRTEWKVKVRSDGTRYITKRPVRDRLLRERALKIREERGGGGGTTTDDDAASELKMGRYWSKEERKQHLLRAREQRRRREFMMRSRLESLRENPQSGGEGGRKEVSILELSHRKMMKKRNRKILDNWMTIQELMTHGARTPEDTSVHNAFLSVTTV